MYTIKMFDGMGRGLVATSLIEKGSIITECELLVLSPEDTKALESTDLKFYTFKYNDLQDCLVLGDGELFNHSDTPNVGFYLVPHFNTDRLFMQFRALKYIEPGEQLFINYKQDTKVEVSNYNTNLIG